MTIESIEYGGAHVLRNPTIYNFFTKMGMVTDVGSGIFRMRKLVKEKIGKEVAGSDGIRVYCYYTKER